ncbi:HotDog domain-containing protein, partial [Lasiosphaeris hirsuta]
NPSAKTRPRGSYGWGNAIFASVTLTFGILLGEVAKFFISPPDVPEPGSEADENVIAALHAQAAQLPIVRQMADDPAWESWDAYNTLTAEHRAQHITAGALAGMRGVGGYQRIFYKAATGEFVSVVFFGPGTGSWPGTVHGGMLATILDESCGRAAFRQWGGRPGVTAYLNVQYKRRTAVDGFYVIRVRARDDDALPEKDRGKRNYKSYVDASIEDAVTGYVTVVADALFVGGEGKKTKSQG